MTHVDDLNEENVDDSCAKTKVTFWAKNKDNKNIFVKQESFVLSKLQAWP